VKIEKVKKCIEKMEKLNKKFNFNFDEEIAELKELVEIVEDLPQAEQ